MDQLVKIGTPAARAEAESWVAMFDWLESALDAPALARSLNRPQTDWRQAIQYRQELERFWGSPLSGRWLDHRYQSGDPGLAIRSWPDRDSFVRAQRQLARHATSLWVASDMMELVGVAACTLPVDTVLAVEDVPFLTGLAVLERPFADELTYGDGVVALAGLSWTPHTGPQGQHGFICGLYGYCTTTGGQYPRLALMNPDVFVPTGAPVGPAGTPEADWARLCATFLLLLGQPLVQSAQQQPPRYLERQAQRADTPVRTICTVDLRRVHTVNSEPGEPAGRDWTHRWMVNSHWRHQWYASEQRHRTILIGPYIKGPDDKPLVLKQRAYRWVR